MTEPTAEEILVRLERLPISGWHTRMRIVLGVCTLFDAYDALAIAFVVPVLAGAWHLRPTDIGLLLSAGFAGQVIGAGGFGWIGERHGRIFALNTSILLVATFGLACAFSWGLPSMLLFRFLQGIGLGGQIPVAATYVNEMAPAHSRGRFTLLYQLVYPIGLVGVGSVSVFLVPRVGWPWIFTIGSLPVVALLFIRLYVPESPRWLARRGRLDEAAHVVGWLERRILGREADTVARPSGVAPLRAVAVRPVTPSWAHLFHGIYLQRTLVMWVVWFASLSIGYGLLSWMPSLYRTVYHLDLQTSLTYTFVGQIFGLACVAVAATFIDVVGRKRMIGGAFVVGAAAMATFAMMNHPSPRWLAIMASLAMGSIGITQISLWTYTPELYPTRMRSLGTGAASTWGRLGSMTAPWMIGQLLSLGHDVSVVFLIYAAFAVIGALAVTLFGVETSRRLLEDVSPDSAAPQPGRAAAVAGGVGSERSSAPLHR